MLPTQIKLEFLCLKTAVINLFPLLMLLSHSLSMHGSLLSRTILELLIFVLLFNMAICNIIPKDLYWIFTLALFNLRQSNERDTSTYFFDFFSFVYELILDFQFILESVFFGASSRSKIRSLKNDMIIRPDFFLKHTFL